MREGGSVQVRKLGKGAEDILAYSICQEKELGGHIQGHLGFGDSSRTPSGRLWHVSHCLVLELPVRGAMGRGRKRRC